MPTPNGDDPLRTTDHEPSPTPAGADLTAVSGGGSPPADAETSPEAPGQRTGPAGTGSERTSASVSVPGYEIEAVLGRGGMGVVYRARHLALKRTVALKMILAGGHAGPGELARFRIEAEAVARLQHPNIVQIHEVGEADGRPYCALEFVEGGNLARRISGNPLPARESAALVEALARAMHLAHSRNVVHRDLKPANVLLAVDGTPKVTDFGLARRLDSDSGETQAGAVVGTPSYMAPEQASGRAHEAGPAADVYALGAILYECLTGRPPFQAATVMDTLLQVLNDEPAPPTRLRPKAPPDLETVCLKCLQKDPLRRYASAQELAEDLSRFLRSEPVTARSVGPLERLGLWWRRNPALGTLGAILAALLLVGTVAAVVAAVGFSELAEQRAKALSDVTAARDDLKSEKDRTLVALGKTKRALGISTQSEALAAWNAGNSALARERLAAVDPEARFWEWGYLQGLFAPRPFSPDVRSGVSHVAWSPDGRVLAAASQDGSISLIAAASGAVRQRVAGHKEGVVGLAFGPDGRHLASAGLDGAVRVWTVSDGSLHRELTAAAGEFTAVDWQPHGDWLALGTQDGRVRLWDGVAGKEGRPLFEPTAGKEPVRVTALAFDPSGRTIARATSDGVLALAPLDGAPPRTFPGEHEVLAMAFSPDGTLLAGGGSLKLQLWDASTGAVVRELPLYSSPPEGYRHVVTAVDFRGDGRRLATSCGAFAGAGSTFRGPDTTVRIWDVAEGRLVRAIRSPRGPVHSVRYSPDGQRLAGGSMPFDFINTEGGLSVWDARGDGDRRLFSGSPIRVGALAFSPEGARLASVGGSQQLFPNPGALTVWDSDSGAVLVSRWHVVALERVAFAPDGRSLATSNAEGGLEVWDVGSGDLKRAVKNAHVGRVAALSYHPGGGRLATFGEDGLVRVWDLGAGKLVAELKRPAETAVRCPTGLYHPGGEYLAVGTRLRFGEGDEDVELWWPEDGGKSVLLDRVKGGTVAMDFSPDGATLAAVSVTGELFAWDTRSRKKVLHFKAHPVAPTSITFSGDGRRLATTARDRSVRVWDVETGRETLALEGPTFAGDSVRFSPDGKRLAAGGGGQFELTPSSGDVFVWDAAPFADSSGRPDTAWHAKQVVDNIGLPTLAMCFHGRFALREQLPPFAAATVLTAHAEFAREMERKGDARLAAAERRLREAADAVATQHPHDRDARAALVASVLAPRWLDAAPKDAVSEGGATLSVDPSGFITAGGSNPDRDAYSLTSPAGTGHVAGVRLLMAPDAGSGSLGRADNGNFDLSEIELSLLAGDKEPAQQVKLSRAWASYNAPAKEHYSKKDMRAEFAVDGDPTTAWNSWPQLKADQRLVVECERPAGEAGDSVRVRLLFQGGDKHSLGRFRLAFTSSSRPALRERWAAELSRRPGTAWTVLAAAAWLDGDPEGVIAAAAKAQRTGETALDAALLAWGLDRKRGAGAEAALDRARGLAKEQPGDPLLEELLGELPGRRRD